MPQIQMLEPGTNFGGQLGEQLGSGISQGIQERLGQFQQRQASERALSGLEPLMKQAGIEFSPEDKSMFVNSGLKAETIVPFLSQFAKQKQEQQIQQHKEQVAQKEVEQAKEQGQKVFDTASKMLKQNLKGIGISLGADTGLNREGVQNRAIFDTLRSKFEATLLPMVSKGALAKERFDYIMSLIPKANESQRSIGGKLYALGHELGFNTKVLEDIPWFKKTLDKVNEGENSEQSKENKPSLKDIFG